MALFKKDRREPVPPAQTDVHDTSVGTAADVEAVMKKYDRESNTRVWEGLPKLVIRWLMVAFSVYCIIDTVFLSTRQEVRLPVFVGLILLFGFLTFPARKGDERVNHMPWYDIVLLIAGPGAYFFYAVNAQNVVQMSARVMQNDLYMIIGLIGILALVELCRRCVGLPILCVAGIISGCITVTGLASKLLSTIVSLSGGHMIIALVLTMLCCIVLGMGVPTTANYCIMAATCAPILMDPSIGVTKMAAHFFVFYFGIVADITPPVALAAYAGSAIAKADPMKTGINATKLAIAAFIVPYIFAVSPQMLFIDVGSSFEVVQICITALLGIFGVAAAFNGFLYCRINPLFRILLIAGGLGMLIPGAVTDIAGLVVVVGVVLAQRALAKKAAAA